MARVGRFVLCCVCLFSGVNFAFADSDECDRPCVENQSPRKCYYHFAITIRWSSTPKRFVLSVNNQSPGPAITVCQNDTIVVDVLNKLPLGLETAIHWHGLRQEGTPHMDGVPMVTQCPIQSRTTFRYQMKASKAGTFYYHAHSVAQQLDGLFGALIIRDEHRHPEKTVLFSPRLERLRSLEPDVDAPLKVEDLVVSHLDGKEDAKPMLLRLINAAALDCPLRVSTETSKLKLVAVDGSETEPVVLDYVLIYPGERTDIIVDEESLGKLRVLGYNLCAGHYKHVLSNKNEPTDRKEILNPIEYFKFLKSPALTKTEETFLQIRVPFDVSVYENLGNLVDFRFKLGEFLAFTPFYFGNGKPIKVSQINKKSFVYPPSPLLSQSDDVPQDLLCSPRSSSCVQDDERICECVQILEIPHGEEMDMILIDEGKNGNTSHAFHVHGHSFRLLALGSFDDVEDIDEKLAFGKPALNLVNPVHKDTVVVPNKGYAILRVKTDNPGYWLVESATSKAESGRGLEMILHVQDKSASVPDGFPTCGTMKEPDMIFGE